jgi:hypothetical protein
MSAKESGATRRHTHEAETKTKMRGMDGPGKGKFGKTVTEIDQKEDEPPFGSLDRIEEVRSGGQPRTPLGV